MSPAPGTRSVNEDTMASMSWKNLTRLLARAALALAVATTLVLPGSSGSATAAAAPQAFASPDRAVAALAAAARAGRADELLRILGPDGRKLVLSGDAVADKRGRERFAQSYATKHSIEQEGDDKAVLVIGDDEWPFPIPIVRHAKLWRFDTKAGAQEILARRIGRNELSAIEVCRAYVDAQREYASKDRNADGLLEYAQKFGSGPGKEDGLYWPAKPGEEESPLGPLVASAHAEGYGGKGKHAAYHGYYYKILKRQGKDAPGGAHDYIAHGRMIGGFALVAFPAQYGASGIMTFLVNQDGVVYEKNLGPDSAKLARAMTAFNPNSTWKTP
jgi:hypothetical protein